MSGLSFDLISRDCRVCRRKSGKAWRHHLCPSHLSGWEGLSAIAGDILLYARPRQLAFIPPRPRSAHKAYVSRHVSMSWLQTMFVCVGCLSWGKRFCRDRELFVPMNFNSVTETRAWGHFTDVMCKKMWIWQKLSVLYCDAGTKVLICSGWLPGCCFAVARVFLVIYVGCLGPVA